MIERHIEKIILGVFVLLLVYAVGHWGVSSPRRIEVLTNSRGGTESVSPGEVDEKLLEAARDVDRVVQNETPPRYDLTDRGAQLSRLQESPFARMQLPSLGTPGPIPLDITDGPDLERPTLKDIVAVMPKPTRPLVRVEWELPRKEEADLADVITAHVAATYSWQEIKNRWNEKLATTTVPNDVIAVAVEAEIRERRFDGTWGDPRPVQAARSLMTDRYGMERTPPNLPDYDETNGEEVRQIIDELADSWQEEILEPSYYEVLWSANEWGTWRIHLAMTSISAEIEVDEDESTKVRQPSPDKLAPMMDLKKYPGPADPYGASLKGGRGAPRGKMGDPKMGGDPMLGRKMRAPQRGRASRSAVRPRTPVPTRRMPTAAYKEPDKPKVTPVPPLYEQMDKGEVLFWIHHTAIEPSKVYQYRARLALVSPLVTFVGDVDSPNDAKQAIIRTPFSEWSNPVFVPRATELFVTGHNASRREASVTVFRRELGSRVKKKFTVSEGQLIGGTANVKLMHPQSGETVRQAADFTTGAVVVRLDFGKTMEKRGNIPVRTVEMYYLDETGQLMTRVVATDRDSDRYEQLQSEVERAKAAARASPLTWERG